MKTPSILNWVTTQLSRAFAGLRSVSSDRMFWTAALGVFALMILPTLVHAGPDAVDVFSKTASTSTSGLDDGLSDFAIILYRVFKVVAVIAGCVGVWRLMEQDYKWGIGCCVCFFALFFMPTIVEIFQAMGASSLQKAQGS